MIPIETLSEQDKYLYYLTYDGAKKKYGDPLPQHIIDKIEVEMDVIVHNGFTDYILIIWDFLNFCSTPSRVFEFCDMMNLDSPPDGIIPIGPGRGSVGGSIVCYSIDIHECDPLRFGLFFERFLNPERIAPPDIDLDISQAYRQLALKYFEWRYGADKVAQIITYSTLSAKSVIEEVLKTANVTNQSINMVKEHVPDDPKITINKLIENEGFMKAMNNVVFPNTEMDINQINATKILEDGITTNISDSDMKIVYDVRHGLKPSGKITVKSAWTVDRAIKAMVALEKLNKHESVHSGGVVISPVTLEYNVPLMKKKDDAMMACQYDMRSLEEIGYIKIDALGLRTVDVNHNAELLVKKWYDPNFDIRKVPYNDPKAIDLIKAGDTIGIFQIESSGFTQMMQDIFKAGGQDTMGEISDFMWICAGLAMYRPGPLDAIVDGKTMVQHLIDRKAGIEPVTYLFPEEESYLKESMGIMIYQEQVMARVRQMTGCSLGRADILRKAMGKKNKVLMKEQTDWFFEEAMKHKFTVKEMSDDQKKHIVERAVDEITTFARYGFNKSHSVEYAHICYRNAYMKANYPVAFYSALMNSEIDNAKRLKVFIRDMIKHGVNLLPPLINKSDVSFSMTDKDTIRFGLSAIKGLGEKGVNLLINERKENGHFTNIEEFRARVPGTACNVNILTNLVKCGAFDDIIQNCIMTVPNRASLVGCVKEINDKINKMKQKKGKNKVAPEIDEIMAKVRYMEYDVPVVEEDKIEYATWEKEVLNFFISAHPMDAYLEEVERWTAITDEVDLESMPGEFYIAGFVSTFHETTIKKEGRNKGKTMGFVTIETEGGAYEATLFPGIYESCLPYMKSDQPVVMKVKKDSYRGQVSLQGVYIRFLGKDGIRDCPECHIRMYDCQPMAMLQLKSLFDNHPGATKVYLYIQSGYNEIMIECGQTVALNDVILNYIKDNGLGYISYKPL